MKGKINFKKEIYTVEILNRAVADYKSICPVIVKNEGDYYKCTFLAESVYLAQIQDEFCNYLIELMNEQVNA